MSAHNLAFLLACLPLAAQAAPRAIAVTAAAERRVALVIGNGAYRDAPLRNPVNDASSMARTLGECGFRVRLVLDADRAGMFGAVREFGRDLSGGGVGLFYYAGHGMAVKGANYLIPVNADITAEHEVPVQALDVASVLGWMEAAGNRLNILVLDACRNNPFPRSFRSSGKGLAQLDAPTGSFVAYATAPGSVAGDGEGTNGLYTQQLLRALQEPGLNVEQVFKRVRVGVKQASLDQQVPWDSSSLTGEFYFRPGSATPPPEAAPPVQAVRTVQRPVKLTIYRKPNSMMNQSAGLTYEVFLDDAPVARLVNHAYAVVPARSGAGRWRIVHPRLNLVTTLDMEENGRPERYFRIEIAFNQSGSITEVDEATWKAEAASFKLSQVDIIR